MTNLDKIQEIMTNAYSRWDSSQWTQKQFWAQLSNIEKSIVFIGNLNYQVENGGFLQWHSNEYSKCYDELMPRLNNIGDFGQAIAKLVYQAITEFRSIDENESDFRGWFDDDDDEESEYDYSLLSELDNKFYKINSNSELLEELSDWANSQESL